MEFQSQTFTNTRVDVDQNSYRDCVFGSGCLLVYRGEPAGPFSNCTFAPGHSWSFEGAAMNTLGLLQAVAQVRPGGRQYIEQVFNALLGS